MTARTVTDEEEEGGEWVERVRDRGDDVVYLEVCHLLY